MSTTSLQIRNQTQEKIIAAALQHFGVTEEVLLNATSTQGAYMRFCCFFLVKKETLLNHTAIGKRFNRGRNTVVYGINTIAGTKDIYRQTLGDLKIISELAGLSYD